MREARAMRFVVGLLLGAVAGAATVRFFRPSSTPPAALRAPAGTPIASGPTRIDLTDAPADPA